MDGFTLSRDVRELLNEDATSAFINDKTTFDYLYEAACDLNSKIHALTSSQTITLVDGTRDYDLNSDFMGLYLKDDYGNFYVKLNDGTSDYWVRFEDAAKVYYLNNTNEVAIPDRFTIGDKQTLTDRIVSAATSAGSASLGECTLTVSTAPFSNVTVGDTVHNTTDVSNGVVIAVTSTSALVTSLFEGTENDWDQNDVCVIVPKGRLIISFDPIPSTSGYTIVVEYLQKPTPVYSDYRTYRFDNTWRPALTKYAAWLYKYRDREPNYGDGWFKYYDAQIRKYNNDFKKSQNTGGFKVYLKKP